MHERLAAQTFNKCWDLLEGESSPETNRELLTNAYASRYHWHQVGGAEPLAIADWMVSRAYVANGEAVLALTYAQHAENQIRETFPAWLKASLYEGVARAHKAAADEANTNLYIEHARQALKHEADPDNATLIRNQLEEL